MMRSIPKVRSAVKNAAGGEPDLIEDGSCDRTLEMNDVVGEDLIDLRHHHRQHFSHMADYDSQPRVTVERSGDHHAKKMHRSFRVPAPTGGFKDAGCALGQTGEIGLAHELRRNMRMDLDRHIELDRGREQAVIAR